jgi:hypothetical protein
MNVENNCVYAITAVVLPHRLSTVENKVVSGISSTKNEAKKLCKIIATSGININRAFVTTHRSEKIENIGNEDASIFTYDSNGNLISEEDKDDE